MAMYFLLSIFLLGVLTPVQTAANARLRQSVGTRTRVDAWTSEDIRQTAYGRRACEADRKM